MRAVGILLIGCAATAAGCAAWPLPTRAYRPEPRTLSPVAPDPFQPGASPPIIPDPNAWVWPRVQLGVADESPPATAVVRTPARVPTSPVADITGDQLPWRSDYESTQRRPIRTALLGAGQQRTLVTASLTGNDAGAVQLMDSVLARFQAEPALLDNCQLLLVRDPNPDGLAEHIAVNSRGVDLNRNFPSLYFTANPTRETGPHPASEVETRVMLRLLGEHKPRRVIHVRTGSHERATVTGNAAALELLSQLQKQFPADVATFDGSFKAGSLEEFAATRLKAEVLVLELPAAKAGSAESVNLILAAVTTGQPVRSDDNAPPPVAESPTASPAALTGGVEPAGPDGEKGYVELLPPPPHFAADEATTSQTRFYELPPP